MHEGDDTMQSKYVRTAGIVLAVLLGAAVLLYLGGLISQIYLGYQQWTAASPATPP